MNNRTLAALLLLAVAGCGGKGDAPKAGNTQAKTSSTASSAPAGSLSAMLCDKKWKTVAAASQPPIDINGDGKANAELIASGELRPCLLDNLESYGADGTYTSENGANRCDSTEKEMERGRWRFNADSTLLLMTPPGGSTEDSVRIMELSDTQLQLSLGVNQGGKNYTLTATYSAK